MQKNNIAQNSHDRIFIFIDMLLRTSWASKWYQRLRIWFSGNIYLVGVDVSMAARNHRFQTNYWCITIYQIEMELLASVFACEKFLQVSHWPTLHAVHRSQTFISSHQPEGHICHTHSVSETFNESDEV